MNFAISGQKRFGLPTGVLGSRQFGTSCKFDIIPRANRFLSHAIINPTKAFENPNFVNKDHPKFFSWASILRIGRQQDSSDCEDDASQPDPEPKSSPASKKYKKSRKRNKKSKRSHTKKTPKRTNKPWHKTKDDEMDLIADFDMTNDTESPTTKSPPVDIEKSVSISPCCRCLSVSSDNSASSSSSSKRLRIASECDSEDSFIIFTEECTEEDTEDSNDDSDFTNETDDDAGDDDIEFDVNFKGCDITNKNKKVTFKCDEELCEFHPVSDWEDDYQLARVGPWEQYARDRARFESRIKLTEETLSPILNSKHRERIYASRFQEHE